MVYLKPNGRYELCDEQEAQHMQSKDLDMAFKAKLLVRPIIEEKSKKNVIKAGKRVELLKRTTF